MENKYYVICNKDHEPHHEEEFETSEEAIEYANWWNDLSPENWSTIEEGEE